VELYLFSPLRLQRVDRDILHCFTFAVCSFVRGNNIIYMDRPDVINDGTSRIYVTTNVPMNFGNIRIKGSSRFHGVEIATRITSKLTTGNPEIRISIIVTTE
jgi:hypothetical protein